MPSEATARFLFYYEFSGDGFSYDPYEIQDAGLNFTGRVRRIRLLKQRGRFGNIVTCILHATMLARIIGADQIEVFSFDLGPAESVVRVREITFSFGSFPGPAEPALVGSFFNTFAFEGCLQAVQPHFVTETIDSYLRPIFHHHIAAVEAGAPDAMVLNFRSGDIFSQPPASTWYVQPPASFYTAAFEVARQHLGVTRAVLVYEDRQNPAVAATEAYLRDRSIPVLDASGGPERDLHTLLGAMHIVVPFSTFTEVAALLSLNLCSYFAFRVLESHAYRHARRIEPLLATVLRARGVRAFVITDAADGYITPEDWKNTPEQRRVIAEYPADGLSVSSMQSTELVGDRLWLDVANNEALRLRGALRAARDDAVSREISFQEERRVCAEAATRQQQRIIELERRISELELKIGESELKTSESETKISESETKISELENSLRDIKASTSWRLTASLRHAMDFARRTRR